MSEFSDQIDQYRSTLMTLEQQMQSSYDKAVMTLSGGALGISFAFLKDVADKANLHSTGWLMAAWIMWGCSVTAVMFSFFTSSIALRRAIRQTDDKDIYVQAVGGACNWITMILNALAGLLFLAGVIAIVIFIGGNIK